MQLLWFPSMFTGILFVVETFLKERHTFSYYLRIFCILMVVEGILYVAKGNADEYIKGDIYIDEKLSIVESIPDIEALTDAQKADFKKKAEHHKREGQRCFKEANEICILIPQVGDRDIAISLFKSAVAMSVSRSWTGIVSALMINLVDYGIAVYEQWNRMNTLLREAEYHFEMMQTYLKWINGEKALYEAQLMGGLITG
jgi:hypothetical protein